MPLKWDGTDYFKYVEDTLKGQSKDSRWYIVCANINTNDTWLWKFCAHEHNYTPVWSDEYGDCSISFEDLEKTMEWANTWVHGHSNQRTVQPILYLMQAYQVALNDEKETD